MKIGILGVGFIGATLVRKLSAAGHHVLVANSRGPDTIRELADEAGATAVTAADAVKDVDVIILSVPLGRMQPLKDVLADVPVSVPVIDTSNYYPLRDGHFAAIDEGQIESEWVQELIGRPVTKAWNAVLAGTLRKNGKAAGDPQRTAIPVAGDDAKDGKDAKESKGKWLSDAQWRRLTETSLRRLPDGRLTPHYDPAMVRQFTDHPDDYELWEHYDRIDIPVLCLRCAQSDLVLPDAVQEMLTRGPGARGLARVVEIPGCGHAPALNVPSQLDLVAGFIEKLGQIVKALMEFKAKLLGLLRKGMETIQLILDDPIGFLGNLIAAVKGGFNAFVGNIWTHLKAGFFKWLPWHSLHLCSKMTWTLPARWSAFSREGGCCA